MFLYLKIERHEFSMNVISFFFLSLLFYALGQLSSISMDDVCIYSFVCEIRSSNKIKRKTKKQKTHFGITYLALSIGYHIFKRKNWNYGL